MMEGFLAQEDALHAEEGWYVVMGTMLIDERAASCGRLTVWIIQDGSHMPNLKPLHSLEYFKQFEE